MSESATENISIAKQMEKLARARQNKTLPNRSMGLPSNYKTATEVEMLILHNAWRNRLLDNVILSQR